MNLLEYDYLLPAELIAQQPVERREMSRLLVLDRKKAEILHRKFSDIIDFLQKGDLLIMNNSRVFPARLLGQKQMTGGKVEILLITQKSGYTWEVIGKGLKTDAKIKFEESALSATVLGKKQDIYLVQFNLSGERFFSEIERIGLMPLPPYIKRNLKSQKSNLKNMEEDSIDKERYQTVYAKERGSVAAPTAGLHFTEESLRNITKSGVDTGYLTLHVGLGTFAPVKTAQIEDHKMHKEFYTISYELIQKIIETKKRGGRVVAVGTTTCRVLETVFRGARHSQLPTDKAGTISAEKAQTGQNHLTSLAELRGVDNSNVKNNLKLSDLKNSVTSAIGGQCKKSVDIEGWTDIFIYPPYKFNCVDALITNFHLPKSTLLMLVSALAGSENIKKSYVEAIKEHYRFFSYGDAMLIV